MRALVTGGAGFIGSHLCEALLRDGHRVTVLDDLSTGRKSNLTNVIERPDFAFVHGSVLNRDRVSALVSDADVVYHLAAAVGTRTILEDPIASLHTNLHGTENVVSAAYKHGASVLLASTSEVYGKNTTLGLRETDDRVVGSPLKSRWSYADAKAIDEMLTYTYASAYGVPAVIVRLFNTVGPRQTGCYGMVIPRFVAQALAGEKLTVHGDGHQVRCFCHVADIVPALIELMTDESAYGQVYNLGSTEQVTIEQLAQRVIEFTGSSSTLDYIPYELAYPPGYEDMARRVPDCTRAHARIGFVPRHSLSDIIEAVVKDQLNAPERDYS